MKYAFEALSVVCLTLVVTAQGPGRVEQKTVSPLVADPNSTLMRMFVNDMAPVLAAVKANPDATIMDVSGGPTLQNNIQWLVVRLPGGSTYLRIIGLPAGRVG